MQYAVCFLACLLTVGGALCGCAPETLFLPDGIEAAAAILTRAHTPDGGGTGGGGAATTSTTSTSATTSTTGGGPQCLTCAQFLRGVDGEVCGSADVERWGRFGLCGCAGACAAACAGSALCGGEDQRPECEACLGRLVGGCGAQRWGCEQGRDDSPGCLTDADCLFAQRCATTGAEPPQCQDMVTSCAQPDGGINWCLQAQCEEPGRYRVTKSIAVDTKEDGRLWQRWPVHVPTKNQAAAFCNQWDGGGDLAGGWRVPTSTELHSLFRYTPGAPGPDGLVCRPAYDQSVFTGKEAWNSTPWVVKNGPKYALTDGYYGGYIDPYPYQVLVRCVHDPLPGGGVVDLNQ